MPQQLVNVEHLSKHYIVMKHPFSPNKRIIRAVDDVSFSIDANESLGLIGESGSGKTTTAGMILKLIPPGGGRISLFGRDVTDLEESAMRSLRKDIQIVFQQARAVLDPGMTVGELIREPLRIHRIVPKREVDDEIDRLLHMTGLSPRDREKFPDQLSGGQNQRVVIARAIAVRPRIIVCDEPVSALDVSVQGQILNLLKRLRRELGLTCLFISHDLKVVRSMCDRIAVMQAGKIVEIGRTEDVIGNPQHAYTRQLISATL